MVKKQKQDAKRPIKLKITEEDLSSKAVVIVLVMVILVSLLSFGMYVYAVQNARSGASVSSIDGNTIIIDLSEEVPPIKDNEDRGIP